MTVWIRANGAGRIETAGADPVVGGIEVTGVPDDFWATFGLGKYRLTLDDDLAVVVEQEFEPGSDTWRTPT